eukprot:COSAG02_NODE_64587_length_260_cov_0.639752_1_plen_86_part_11
MPAARAVTPINSSTAHSTTAQKAFKQLWPLVAVALKHPVLVARHGIKQSSLCLAAALLTRKNVGFNFSRCVDCSGDYEQAVVAFWL